MSDLREKLTAQADALEKLAAACRALAAEMAPNTSYIFRSAVNGEIVTQEYAEDNPDITVMERVD